MSRMYCTLIRFCLENGTAWHGTKPVAGTRSTATASWLALHLACWSSALHSPPSPVARPARLESHTKEPGRNAHCNDASTWPAPRIVFFASLLCHHEISVGDDRCAPGSSHLRLLGRIRCRCLRRTVGRVFSPTQTNIHQRCVLLTFHVGRCRRNQLDKRNGRRRARRSDGRRHPRRHFAAGGRGHIPRLGSAAAERRPQIRTWSEMGHCRRE